MALKTLTGAILVLSYGVASAQPQPKTFFKERVFLDQEYAMDTTQGSVGNMLTQAKATIGENVVLRRFSCFSISDDVE